MTEQFVYYFGKTRTDGGRDMKALLGGKGANLAEMTSIGLSVPPGFTITTEACDRYNTLGGRWPQGLEEQVRENISMLEKELGRGFGDPRSPLLLSVRSGAAVSMPGMMDTVLNLGIGMENLDALKRMSGNPRFALDSLRRFMQMFGDVVVGVPHHDFEHALESVKSRKGVRLDTELDAADLEKVVDLYQDIYMKKTGSPFPSDPWEQLRLSVNAVFDSWNNPRAVRYRELNEIRGLRGTAVNVQSMVFGNMGEGSGTGVCFTRDPSTGENVFYGEYLMNAQGEDVVAGIRTPHPISDLARENRKAYDELVAVRGILERHYLDMQDIEFTIQNGELFILQTRSGKRTVFAALNMAVDMVEEGLIDRETALMRVPAQNFNQLFASILDASSKKSARLLTRGLNASPGGACGAVVFNAHDAEEWAGAGKDVILCRQETSPEDIGGMAAARGVLTARGGMTSHAAVVARGMGAPCVAGAGELVIDSLAKTITLGNLVLREGDILAIDGFTGEVFAGEVTVRDSEIVQVLRGSVPASESSLFRKYNTLVGWADQVRTLKVRTNADTPRDTEMAVLFGAEGVGLCRTEHMFFEGDRIRSFRKLILVAEKVKRLRERISAGSGDTAQAENLLKEPERIYREALGELHPLQRQDFEGIFRALNGRPCNIRLLDPPLHEFLPHDRQGQEEMAAEMGVSLESVVETVTALQEFNPMMGHRGCRLGLSYPEVTEMQVRAVIEAAIAVTREGVKVIPEIMIPLVGHVEELRIMRRLARETAEKVLSGNGLPGDFIDYSIGTMIEVPRACVTAEDIASEADFFSFGTNDLTQMGCGFSRDDAGKFLGDYVRMGIYERDPFQSIDEDGVGALVMLAVRGGRRAKPGLKLGVCGEHGGDAASIRFFQKAGLDYVSCSPYRVPVARLAAAQAVIEANR
jgi:pyruvate,orthophosphate dikinase